jgi:hypothetical protein
MGRSAAIQTDLRVSIQARWAVDPARGHLATGLLADDDCVLMPDPPADLLRAPGEVEVVIIPVEAEQQVERMPPVHVMSVLRVDDSPRLTWIAILKLATPSRYAPQVGPCNGPELGRKLELLVDMWAALEAIGAVRAEYRRIPPDLLEGLPDRERLQRIPRSYDRIFARYKDLGNAFCIWPPLISCGMPSPPVRFAD